MKIKRIILTLASALLLSAVLFGVCSCGSCDGSENTTASPSTDDPNIILTSLLFAEDMPVRFTAIRSYRESGSTSRAIADFVATLEANTGAEISVMRDADRPNEGRFEILIGNTDRRESNSLSESIGGKEYRIKVMGYKLVIVGGSEDALLYGMTQFLDKQVKGHLSVDLPLDFQMNGSID